MFSPVFEKDETRLFLFHSDFIASTEEEAYKIGIGSMFVECVVLGMKFVHEVIDIERDLPHFETHIGHVKVGIISGKLFDESSNGEK